MIYMTKKILSILVALSLVFSCVQGFCLEDTASVSTVYTLSLHDAIEMALSYSPDLECWEINQKNYQIQLNSALSAQKANKNTPVYASQNYELTFVKRGYYVDAAKSQIRLSAIEHDKIVNTISYDITQKYYTVKNTAKMCEIAASALQRANENKAITQKRFELGTCTQLEVDNASIAVMQCEANLEKTQNALVLCEDNLKIALGIEGECELVLTDEIAVSPFSADLESDTKNAIQTRYDVNGLKEAADLAVTYFGIVSGLSTKSTTYFSAYTNSITAKHQFSTGVKNIELLIKSAYYSALESETSAQIAKKSLEYAKSAYEVNKLRHEMGMITAMVLSASSDELTNAESAYQSALLTQKLANEKYSYEIHTGI